MRTESQVDSSLRKIIDHGVDVAVETLNCILECTCSRRSSTSSSVQGLNFILDRSDPEKEKLQYCSADLTLTSARRLASNPNILERFSSFAA